MKHRGVYIPSLEAKDLVLAANDGGYRISNEHGYRLRKFVNSFDYSLDLIKLRSVYKSIYRNNAFTFFENGHEYCPYLVNVTFKYSDKLFNRRRLQYYVRSGYSITDDEFNDCVCFKDGVLAGVQTGCPINNPLTEDELDGCFIVKDGCYQPKTNMPIVHGVAELRNILYEDGFYLDGKHYVRYKRSSGSSRVGKCLFIEESLYPKMHKWDMCGIKIKENEEVDLAALEAYIALTMSSIIDTLTIQPNEILVIDDFESCFKDKVVITDVCDGKLRSYSGSTEISNSIWDGQSLIDSSLISHGMVLLRNRFFKSCCFNTNIQKFFSDNNITKIEQLNGFTLAGDISQIKLITTPSSIKYLKFGTLQQWLSRIEPTFGVVKHEKKTHFFDGELVQTHYQLINTLQLSQTEMDEFLEQTVEYVKLLRYNPEVLRYHIKYPDGYESVCDKTKNDVVFHLMGVNSKFCYTRIYYDFMRDLVRSYVKNSKCGHILVHGNYSTLFGNPYEMLLQSIGKFNGRSELGIGHVHTHNFEYNRVLLGSRSPHVCMGNIWLPYNVPNQEIDTYFNLTDEIVCINSIGENVLQRLSGCDFDSDTVMLTDNDMLIAAAQKNYDKFLVPTSAVTAKKTKRRYTNLEKSDLDIRTSDNKIGEIINLAQRLNTLFWHNVNNGQSFESNFELYCDVAKLDVMSGIEIDKAKKEFVVDVGQEIKDIKEKYFPKEPGQKNIKPNFFGIVSRLKGYYDLEKNQYVFHDTSMDYLQHTLNKLHLAKMEPWEGQDFSLLLAAIPVDYKKVDYRQIDNIFEKVRLHNKFINSLWMKSEDEMPADMRFELSSDSKKGVMEYVSKTRLNKDTIATMLKKLDEEPSTRFKRQVLDILFGTGNQSFYDLIRSHKEPLPYLEPCENGNINLYGMKFQCISPKSE